VPHPIRHRLVVVGVLALVLVVTGCSSTERVPSPPGPRAPGGPSAPAEQPDMEWVGDFETGDLSQFKDTPWNVTRGGEQPRVVSDPQFVREGRYAVRIAIPTAETKDREGACCDPRSELEPNIADIRPGYDLWFRFSTMLAADFPVDADWQVITQWKGRADGSPPVSLNVEKGRFVLRGGAGHPDDLTPFSRDLAAAAPGEWSDWLVHIRFSPRSSEGFVEVWRNGQQVLERFSPESGTMYPGEDGDPAESYLKTGYYRDGKISRPGVLYLDSWRVGNTRDAVAAPA